MTNQPNPSWSLFGTARSPPSRRPRPPSTPPAATPTQDRYDALVDSADESMCALLALPAPDLPALAAKLDIIVPHFAWELTGSGDCLEILRRDAHRLAATMV